MCWGCSERGGEGGRRATFTMNPTREGAAREWKKRRRAGRRLEWPWLESASVKCEDGMARAGRRSKQASTTRRPCPQRKNARPELSLPFANLGTLTLLGIDGLMQRRSFIRPLPNTGDPYWSMMGNPVSIYRHHDMHDNSSAHQPSEGVSSSVDTVLLREDASSGPPNPIRRFYGRAFATGPPIYV